MASITADFHFFLNHSCALRKESDYATTSVLNPDFNNRQAPDMFDIVDKVLSKAFPGEGDRDSVERFLSTNESGPPSRQQRRRFSDGRQIHLLATKSECENSRKKEARISSAAMNRIGTPSVSRGCEQPRLVRLDLRRGKKADLFHGDPRIGQRLADGLYDPPRRRSVPAANSDDHRFERLGRRRDDGLGAGQVRDADREVVRSPSWPESRLTAQRPPHRGRRRRGPPPCF